jgi:hypothetical protein
VYFDDSTTAHERAPVPALSLRQPTMKIACDYSSALGGSTRYLLELDPLPSMRSAEPQPVLQPDRAFEFRRGTFAVLYDETVDDLPTATKTRELTSVELSALTEALLRLKVAVALDSNKVYSACDGWSGELEIDSCDFKCRLAWFLAPPMQWQGLPALIELLKSLEHASPGKAKQQGANK